VAELDDFTAIKKASLELLTQLGIPLTDTAKRELSGAESQQAVNAQTALARGITAQRSGTVVESLAYYFQAVNYDPAQAEAASRLNILSANISSGNMGQNVRNDIQWRRQWVDRLTEAETFYANYVRQPTPYYLVYSTNLRQGKIDYASETVTISGVTLDLVPNHAWIDTLGRVVNTVRSGLLATKRAEEWGLDWPTKSIAAATPFVNRDESLQVAVELLNDQGQTIGSEVFTLQGGWRVQLTEEYEPSYGRKATRSIQLRLNPRMPGPQQAEFRRVNANLITDRLTVKIKSINGVDAETAAKTRAINILTEAQYGWLPEVRAKTDSRYVYNSFRINSDGYIAAGDSISGGALVIPPSRFGISVIAIYGGGFEGKQLTSVTIPNSVTSIGYEAFRGNRLTSVTIPNSVTSIGGRAFLENQLTSITIPNSVTSIGALAFAGNRLTSVTIPNSVTSIDTGAFAGNRLTSVTIPNSVTSIGTGVFRENQLTSVTIPNSVTSIGAGAFVGNRLTSITIGANVRFSALDDFGGYFESAYDDNGSKAGTYRRPDTSSDSRWTYRP
jgi:hypothetical protein